MPMLGSNRWEALARVIVGTIWAIIAWTLLVAVWFPVAVIIGIIDVLWQFITNSEGIGWSSSGALTKPFTWAVKNTEWWLLGKGEFDALPYL